MDPTLFAMPTHRLPSDDELAEEFVILLDLDPKSKHKYRQHLDEFRLWLGARADGRRLTEAQTADVKRFLADLKEGRRHGAGANGKRRSGPLGASSRKCVLVALRSFYANLFDLYQFSHDPTRGIKAPRVKVKRGVSLNERQLRIYLDAPGSERDRVQAYLKVYTAARTMSLRNLRWEDVDLERGLLHFNAKFENDYSLPMHPQLKAALLRWQREVVKLAERYLLRARELASSKPEKAAEWRGLAAALEDPETAYVLLSRTGRQLCGSTIAKQSKWRAARVDLLPHANPAAVSPENKSRVSPHAFRRSGAQNLRSKGVELADIAELLNHKDLNTTRLHYAYTDTPKLRKTVMALGV